jgi:hypothetical protein
MPAKMSPNNVGGVLAAGETVTNSALAVTSINNSDGIGAGSDSYNFYQGDGSTGAGWPDQTQWLVVSSQSINQSINHSIDQSWCGNQIKATEFHPS